jgi:chemotaxis family two-component system response regulator Rcp1
MAEESGLNRSREKEQSSISPSRSTPNQSVPQRFNLLLAEDNLPDALLVREAIRRENLPIDLHIVSDGQQAIEFIERAENDNDAPCPQCMLLDLNLPKVEGFEILRRVRASEKCGAIPVVVITSSDSPSDRSQAAALGAGYFRRATRSS